MSKLQLQLPFTSLYKNTALYTKAGKVFFGLWEPPQIAIDGDEAYIQVEVGQGGQLDLIADKYYGDRTLWWVIAYANKIGSVTDEVTPGKRIIIPKIENVRAALTESSSAASI